ncbi:MAG: FAD-dependent oxidoreductase [Chlorobiaceae bacterium]|nr:FAD-dependent oxidoreductase [Chlorobiaceae bacterium]
MISRQEVIVVGAGIAGLAAAHTLRRSGLNVRILESSWRAGGRMTTDWLHGMPIDRGAQFLSTGYHVLRSLAGEVGCSSLIHETSPIGAVVRAGAPRRLRAGNPSSPLFSGLLGLRELMALGRESFRHRGCLGACSLSDFSAWSTYDDETVKSWSDRLLGHSVTDFMFDPMLRGFYFQSAEETSRALAMVLAAFSFRRSHTLTCDGGIGTLPGMLARNLDVVFDTPVLSVDADGDTVRVTTASGTLLAGRVIVAIPAPLASMLIRTNACHPVECRLLSTGYSSSINIGCIASADFRLPGDLRDVYGVLVPSSESREIVGIGIERNKFTERLPADAQLFNIMLSDACSRRVTGLPDEEVVRLALVAAERFLPGLASTLAASLVCRWPLAEPRSPVGRSADLQAYRRMCREANPAVLLAGDYMSMPYTEGAAESGVWAAEQVLSRRC